MNKNLLNLKTGESEHNIAQSPGNYFGNLNAFHPHHPINHVSDPKNNFFSGLIGDSYRNNKRC